LLTPTVIGDPTVEAAAIFFSLTPFFRLLIQLSHNRL
jgi:hypothetical protein